MTFTDDLTEDNRLAISSGPGWEALAEAHREVMEAGYQARQEYVRQASTHRVPEPGSPQQDYESPNGYLQRVEREREAAWQRVEAED